MSQIKCSIVNAPTAATTASGLFVGYSVLNGLTLSVIFLAYTSSSIAGTFFITAGMFGSPNGIFQAGALFFLWG